MLIPFGTPFALWRLMVEDSADVFVGPVLGLKYFKRLSPLLARLRPCGCRRDKADNRLLYYDDYVKLVLLYTWNPAIESMRDLQRVLAIPGVAKRLGIKRFSAGSFSESVRVFEPQLLQAVVAELAGGLKPLSDDPRLSELQAALTLVDGSILGGLSRLAKSAIDADGVPSTRYNTARDGRGMYGKRLHLQLDLATFSPQKWTLTDARNAGSRRENNVLRHSLQSGRCYVGDGGYADASLFNDIDKAASNFVIRMRTDNVFDVVEERLLSQDALNAGVVRDTLVWLGKPAGDAEDRPVRRLVTVQIAPHPRRTRHGTRAIDLIVIATNLLDLAPELIALIYRQRYTVELFFRFLKQLLGLRHLLSRRTQGIEIQIYCAVIAMLMLQLTTGRRPDRGTTQMLGWYLIGLATEDDLLAYLNKPDNTGVKLKAKNELWKKLGF